MHRVDGLSARVISRRAGLARDTLARLLAAPEPPKYVRLEQRLVWPGPRIHPWCWRRWQRCGAGMRGASGFVPNQGHPLASATACLVLRHSVDASATRLSTFPAEPLAAQSAEPVLRRRSHHEGRFC
jgi:hypothetical protein